MANEQNASRSEADFITIRLSPLAGPQFFSNMPAAEAFLLLHSIADGIMRGQIPNLNGMQTAIIAPGS